MRSRPASPWLLFPAALALALFAAPSAQAQMAFDNVAEAAGYTEVFRLAIPTGTLNWNTNAVPYSVNNAAGIADGSFTRVAYYMELQTPAGSLQWVYASFDTFTPVASRIGVPSRGPSGNGNFIFQQLVTNMNVRSNVAGVVTGDGITTGNIEFWSRNYGGTNPTGVPNANTTLLDFGDMVSTDPTSGYGSMQIHNHDLDGAGPGGVGQSLLSFSHFGNGAADLGIGNRPTSHPDWTFINNSTSFNLRNLQVLVQVVPEPSTWLMLGLTLGMLGFHVLRPRRGPGGLLQPVPVRVESEDPRRT